MSNGAAVQELFWPLLKGLHDLSLDKIPGELRESAIASVFPFLWDDLVPEQRESVIKQSDYPNDPAARNAFQAGFHGFDDLAKMGGITATEAAEALLQGSSLFSSKYNVDSLARTLSTNEELNAARPVFHSLAEWLRRARATGMAYLSSLDWAVEQSIQAAAQSATAHSGAVEILAPQATRPGVSKREILSVEWPMPKGAPALANTLDNLPKWIAPACTKVGRAGKGVDGSHLWNPALLAVCLTTKTPQKQWAVGKGSLTSFLRLNFGEYFEQWEDAAKEL